MIKNIKSIRPFIGAKDYAFSRSFYKDLGFQEVVTSAKMSYFYMGDFGFYLQDYYVKDWIDNSMVFLEIEAIENFRKEIIALKLDKKYPNVRVTKIHYNDWGNEFFVYDPSGILWHFGVFN